MTTPKTTEPSALASILQDIVEAADDAREIGRCNLEQAQSRGRDIAFLLDSCSHRISPLLADNARLREALEFYASQADGKQIVEPYPGAVARVALKEQP